MEWFVELSGDSDDLEELSNVCSSEELTIEKYRGSFVLKSKEFSKFKDETEVYEKANEIVDIVNGASVIVLGTMNLLKASRTVIKIDDDGKRIQFFISEPLIGEARVKGSFKGELKKADGSIEVIYQASPITQWFNIAKENKKVASVLKKLSEDDLDVNKINIIFEDIEGDVGSLIIKKGWALDDDINRFTQFVQPYRHGESGLKKRKWKSSEKPMEFYEAKALMLSIVSKWINSKVGDRC